MQSAALEISCWLGASCPANLNFYRVLESRHNLQRDKQAETALFTAYTEGLSDEGSLARKLTVFRLHNGNQTPEVQRGLCVATSTAGALGTLSKTGNKIQVNKSHSAASSASKQRHVLAPQQPKLPASSTTHSTQGHSHRSDTSYKEQAFIHPLWGKKKHQL